MYVCTISSFSRLGYQEWDALHMAVVCEMLEKSYCDRVILASLKKSHSDVLLEQYVRVQC